MRERPRLARDRCQVQRFNLLLVTQEGGFHHGPERATGFKAGGVRGQRQDWHARLVEMGHAIELRGLVPAELGHVDVHQHEVDAGLIEDLQRLLAVVRGDARVAAELEDPVDDRPVRRIVLGQQDLEWAPAERDLARLALLVALDRRGVHLRRGQGVQRAPQTGLVDGLPIGMQVYGKRHQEALLLDLALIAERERPWPRVVPGAPV